MRARKRPFPWVLEEVFLHLFSACACECSCIHLCVRACVHLNEGTPYSVFRGLKGNVDAAADFRQVMIAACVLYTERMV